MKTVAKLWNDWVYGEWKCSLSIVGGCTSPAKNVPHWRIRYLATLYGAGGFMSYTEFCWTNPVIITVWRASNTMNSHARPVPQACQPQCEKYCTWADPSSCCQHTRVFNTLSENLLHLSLQGPHVGVRTVWLWKGKEQLMLPERCLKWRKWLSELLSKICLRAIQNSKKAQHPSCHCVKFKNVLSCVSMQST